MSRKSSINKPSKYSNSRLTEDPFANDDLSLDFTDMENNYGKRTGKYYEPSKWRRTPSGFMQYPDDDNNDDDESFTSEEKIKKIRKGLGIVEKESQQSPKSSRQSQKEAKNQPEPRILIKKPPIQSLATIKEKRRETVKIQLDGSSTSWELDLNLSFHDPLQSSGSDSEQLSNNQIDDDSKKSEQFDSEDEKSERQAEKQLQLKAVSTQKSKQKSNQKTKKSLEKINKPKSSPKNRRFQRAGVKEVRETGKKESLRKPKVLISYNEYFPKYSQFQSQQKKKVNSSPREDPKEKQKSQEKNWQLQIKRQEQMKKSYQKRRSQERKKTENRRKSKSKQNSSDKIKNSQNNRNNREQRKLVQRKRSEQRKKSEEKNRSEQRKRQETRKFQEYQSKLQEKNRRLSEERNRQKELKRKQQEYKEMERQKQQEKKQEKNEIRREKRKNEKKAKEQEMHMQKIRKQLQKKTQEEERYLEERLKQQEKRRQKKKNQQSKKKQEDKRKQQKTIFSKLELQKQRKPSKSKHSTKQRKRANQSEEQASNIGQSRQKKHERKSLNSSNSRQKQKPTGQKMQIYQQHSYPKHKRLHKSKPSQIQDAYQGKLFDLELSQIKEKRRKSGFQNYSPNESIRSLVDEIDRDNEPQSSDWLNKAVINTQSQNFNQRNNQDQCQQDKINAFKKNKVSGQIHKIQKKASEKPQTKKSDYFLRGKSFQEDFLTDSIKKGAQQYHQKNQKSFERKKQKQILEMKVKKRDRQTFEKLQTNDILDQQKVESLRLAYENQKGNKKFKTNENKKDIKITKQSKLHASQDESEQYKNLYTDNPIQFEKKKKQQQRVAEENRRRIKQAEKDLKKKDKPKRVSPKKVPRQKTKKDALPKPLKKKTSNKQADKSEDFQIDGPSYHSVKDSFVSSNPDLEDSRRYPRRNRIPRTNFWYKKVVYNAKRQVIGVQTKAVHDLIGWSQEGSIGEIDPVEILARGDEYIEKLKIHPKSTLEFRGFDDQFSKLEIFYQKNKANGQIYGKQIEVYHDEQQQRLTGTVTVLPDTGSISIVNRGSEVGYIEMVLTINNSPEQDLSDREED